MDAQSRVKLRCQQCGHEWKGRSSTGIARQCSKCRSRQIAEVNDDDHAASDAVTIMPNETVNQVAAIPIGLMDDPEIRQKMKELELARIERKIAEEGARVIPEAALINIANAQKMLLQNLHSSHVIDDNMFVFLSSMCPWCGNGSMHQIEVKPDILGWRCKSCGKELV